MARRQRNSNKTSWTELILFVMIIICIYLLLSLFNSSLTGESGREWGRTLREKWGGAVIVLLLFWLYVCIAKFMKLRIPRLPRQILGTIQLYISLAFTLGFLHETGWTSEMTLFLPGSFGVGLAKFFILNIGTFITLILLVCSFIFSAVLYGSKILRLSMPALPAINFNRTRRRPRRRREREATYRRSEDYELPEENGRLEDILFTQDIPEPNLKPSRYDYHDDDNDSYNAQIMDIPMPSFKPSHDDEKAKPKRETPPMMLKTGQKAIEHIDDALAIINAGTSETSRKKPSDSSLNIPAPRPRKLRRPLPEVTFPDSRDTPASSTSTAPVRRTRSNAENDDAVFPPPAELFGESSRFEPSRSIQTDINRQGLAILNTLKNFNIDANIAQTSAGPSVVQYKLELASGTKLSRLSGLDDEIGLDLSVSGVRIEAPILGTRYVGVEIPVRDRKTVTLRSLIESGEFINSDVRLPLPLGVRTSGRVMVKGLEEMPVMLVAGAEGSGRRTFINACIMSLCSGKTPEELKLILIDPRHTELAAYEGLPHLLAEPVTGLQGARKALEWACDEMEKRTADFSQEKTRNIEAYNRKISKNKRLPEIVIVISELSDLIYSSGNEFSDLIVKLARKSGSVGIYMLLSAQKPSIDVVPSVVKSMLSARAAFAVSSQSDSKNIIDSSDAARLTGKGDMLFVSTGSPVPVRLQAPYISDGKVSDFVDYMTSSLEAPDLITF